MASLTTRVPDDIDTAQRRLASVLSEHGFGVLWDLDLQAIFADKLGVEHEGQRILGVCNPTLAKSALDVDRDVALLLPCTAMLREVEGGTEVSILDPAHAFQLADADTRDKLDPIASEARGRLAAAIEALD